MSNPHLLELVARMEELILRFRIQKHTEDVSKKLFPLTENERQREIFSRKLKGEEIDEEHLQTLLQEHTHESKSN